MAEHGTTTDEDKAPTTVAEMTAMAASDPDRFNRLFDQRAIPAHLLAGRDQED